MNIIVCIPNINLVGGAEKQCLLLAEEWTLLGHKVLILCEPIFDKRKNGVGKREIPLDWLSFRNIESNNIFNETKTDVFDLFTVSKIDKITVCRPNNYNSGFVKMLLCYADLVHFHIAPINSVFYHEITESANIPITFRVVSSNQAGDSSFFKLNEAVMRMLANVNVKLIALDRKVKSELVDIGIERYKISILKNGVRSKIFIPDETKCRFKKGIDCVFLGRFVPKKQIHFIIKAWKEYLNMSGIGSLKIVGDGPLKEELFNYSKNIGLNPNDIFFQPVYNDFDKVELFSASSIFLYPTYGDATPNALLEAMSSGLVPIVSWDSGYDFLDDGLNCFKVSPEKSNEFASKLLYLSSQKGVVKSIQKSARKFIESKHDITKTGKNYLKLFKYLVQDK